jgi:hypothetical protein
MPVFERVVEAYARHIYPMMGDTWAWIGDHMQDTDALMLGGATALVATSIAIGRKKGKRKWLALPLVIPLYMAATIIPFFREPMEQKFPNATPAAITQTDNSTPAYYYRLLDHAPTKEELTPPPLDVQCRLIERSMDAILRRFGDNPPHAMLPRETALRRWYHEKTQFGGMTIPFNFSPSVYDGVAPAPRTVNYAHEMAHAKGYLLEGEAEFLANLALLNCDQPYLRAVGVYGRLYCEGGDPPAWFMGLCYEQREQPPVPEAPVEAYTKLLQATGQGDTFMLAYLDQERRLFRDLESRVGCDGVMRIAKR